MSKFTDQLKYFSRHYWWFIVLVVWGLIWRLWQWGQLPPSLYWDEMAIWDDARSIATTGKDLHNRQWWQPLFISYGDYKLPLYIWLTAVVSWFVNSPLFGVRLVSLIAGLSWLPAIYLLARQLNWHKSRALWATGFAALLPWAVHFSRTGFEGHLAAVLLTWSLVGLLALLSAKKHHFWWLLLVILTGVGAFYSYFSVRYVWPSLVAVLALVFYQHGWRYWRWLLAAMLLWVMATLPMWRADFYNASTTLRLSTVNVVNQPERIHQINLYRQRAGNNRLAKLLYNKYTFIAHDLSINTWEFMDPTYLFLKGDSNLRHNSTGKGLMLLVTAPIFVSGWLYLWRREQGVFWLFLLWWLLAILPAAVPQTVPHALRSLNGVAVFPLVLASGWQWILKQWSSKRTLLILFLLFFFMGEICWSIFYSSTVYPKRSATDWQVGYLPAAEYIAHHQEKYDHVFVDIDDDRFYLYYLPFSDLGWSEIQQLETAGFHFWQVENVNFHSLSNEDLNNLPANSLVVTTQNDADLGQPVLAKFGSAKQSIVIYETE